MENPTYWLWLYLAALIALAAYSAASAFTHRIPRLPLGFLILYFALRVVAAAFRMAGFLPDFHKWIDFSAALVLSFACARFAFLFFIELPLFLRNKPALPKITRDFALLLSYGVLAIILLWTHADVNLAGLITTSAVLTAVIGLGAQTTLRSFFSGLSLQLEKPFELGDWVRVGDYDGKVVGISWKTTRLATRDNAVVHIPNEDLLAGKFINYTKADPAFLCKISIGLDYGVPPNKVRKALLEVLRRHPLVLAVPPPEVRLGSFGDSAIQYDLRFPIKDFAAAERIKGEINNRIWYALKRDRINIPFPIRDVSLAHIERARQEKIAEETRKEIEAKLAGVPVLAALSDKERALLASRVSLLPFGSGEAVVSEGEEGDSLYVIHSGACEVLKEDGQGRNIQVARIQNGDFFGEMSLLTGEKRSATVRTAEDSLLIRIEKALFAEWMSSKPEIVSILADALARRKEELGARAASSAHRSDEVSSLKARIKAFFEIR